MVYTTEKKFDEASEPFLQQDTASEYDKEKPTNINLPAPDRKSCSTHCTRPRALLSAKHVLFHVGLVAIYTLLSALTIMAIIHNPALAGSSKYEPPPWIHEAHLRPTPALFRFSLNGASPYAGPAPNQTIDAAWTSLLSRTNMRVSDHEMALSRLSGSVKLNQGGGHGNLIWLGVFHELQCLKLLREYVHRDLYYADRSERQLEEISRKADVCVEVLRQRAMCKPDLDMVTSSRQRKESKPVVGGGARLMQCMDWDRLVASLEERVLSGADMEGVTEPVLGDGS